MHIVLLIITFLAFGPDAQIHYGVYSFEDNDEACEIVADVKREEYGKNPDIRSFAVFCEAVQPGDSV